MEQPRPDDEPYDVPRLEITNVIGFNGQVTSGLKFHPDREHIVYPLGCAVVIESIRSKKQPDLLWGHTDYVTCIAISNKDGNLIASGQRTHMGFKADVIVWDYPSRQQLYKLNLHKVKVEALAFSPNNLYLASLGGCDDGSVVIWNMADGKAICGDQAQVKSAGNTLCICFSKKSDNVFVTGGESTLRVWELDVENRKIRPAEVDMGQIKRKIECIVMDDASSEHPDRQFFYCGTTTGDVLAINMKSRNFQFQAPLKNNFENGVTALTHVKRDCFLVGTGCGKLYELQFPLPSEPQKGQKANKQQPKPILVGCWQDNTVKSNSEAAITSITLRGAGHQFYVGTRNGRMYSFLYEDKFKDCKLIKTCHSSRVNDVAFPPQSSQIFVTCQKEQIRIWDMKTMSELQRYIVPNMTCNSITISDDGTFILTAWDDGQIRVFGFKGNGELVIKSVIANAHSKGVTAIACTRNRYPPEMKQWDFNIISGGGEGQVRVWNYRQQGNGEPSCRLQDTLKEHKGLVSDIKVTRRDDMCVSSSTDGTCIIWDLEKRRRRETVFANTLFKCVVYNKDENQIITSGTDRKIGYWESDNGALIRELEGAKTEAVNAMDISYDGEYFVSGGDDKLLKVWTYDRGEVVAVGQGHSGNITRVRICPNMRNIVSVSEDGAILCWKFPFPPKQ